MSVDRGGIQELVSLGVAGIEARRVGDSGTPYVTIPEGWQIEEMERVLPMPTRTRGTVGMHDTDSLIAWVNERKGAETRVYATNNPTHGVTIVAVMNDATSREQPSWRDWRAVYSPMVSPEWAIWTQMSGKRGGQREFAEFIEANVDDVFSGSPSEPPGAVLLELASVLQATIKAEFASATRLSNGATQLRYAETISASGGSGSLEMPEMFYLGIPVFIGGPTYKVGARLRYRINSNTLQLGYDLVRPHKVVEMAAGEILGRVKAETGVPVYMGMP